MRCPRRAALDPLPPIRCPPSAALYALLSINAFCPRRDDALPSTRSALDALPSTRCPRRAALDALAPPHSTPRHTSSCPHGRPPAPHARMTPDRWARGNTRLGHARPWNVLRVLCYDCVLYGIGLVITHCALIIFMPNRLLTRRSQIWSYTSVLHPLSYTLSYTRKRWCNPGVTSYTSKQVLHRV